MADINIRLTGDSSSAEKAISKTNNALSNLDKSVKDNLNQKLDINTSKFDQKISGASISTEKLASILNTTFSGSGINFGLIAQIGSVVASLKAATIASKALSEANKGLDFKNITGKLSGKIGKLDLGPIDESKRVRELVPTKKWTSIGAYTGYAEAHVAQSKMKHAFDMGGGSMSFNYKNDWMDRLPANITEKVKELHSIKVTDSFTGSLTAFSGILAFGVAVTKIGVELSSMMDSKKGLWDSLNDKLADYGDKLSNFFTNVNDIVEETSKNLQDNMKEQQKTGISKAGTKKYLDSLYDTLISGGTDQATKDAIKKQIELVKSGELNRVYAEKKYGINIASMQKDQNGNILQDAGSKAFANDKTSIDTFKYAISSLKQTLQGLDIVANPEIAGQLQNSISDYEKLLSGAEKAQSSAKEFRDKISSIWDTKDMKKDDSKSFTISDSLRKVGGFANSALRQTNDAGFMRMISLTERIAIATEKAANNIGNNGGGSQWYPNINPWLY